MNTTKKTDLEKIINGLEEIRDCEIIVYKYRLEALEDALALLKAQEAVKPSWRRGIPFCGKCGRHFADGFKYCPDCGREVNWK